MKQSKTIAFSSVLLSAAILITSLATSFSTDAQSPNCQWGKPIDNGSPAGKSIALHNFGNEYITGVFRTPYIVFGRDTLFNHGTGKLDYYLAKYDHLGNLIWAKSAGGNQDEYTNGIAIDPTGNIYVGGNYNTSKLVLGNDTMDYPGNSFLVKYDSSGNMLWARTSKGEDMLTGGIATDNEGNVYMTGHAAKAPTSTLIFGI